MSQHGDSPMKATLVSMTGAAADEHDTAPPGANPLSEQAGHEPDHFGVRAILYVPALVVVTLISAYVLITAIFSVLVNPGAVADARPGQNEQVAANVDRPINDRFATISSTDPKPAVADRPGTEVPAPRLEYLRQQGDTNDPPYLRSKRPLQEGNPPEIRPDFLRPENYVDPATGQKILLAAEAVPSKDEKLARIPIDVAIKLATTKGGKLALPVAKDAKPAPLTTETKAKFSNGGSAPVADEPHDHKHDHKHDDGRKH